MAQHLDNLDSSCVLRPAPLVPGVPSKTRLESRIKKFNPPFQFSGAAVCGPQQHRVDEQHIYGGRA